MDNMFYGCEALAYIDLSGFNLENLKNANQMLAYCGNLEKIKFNENTITKNLETMEAMYMGCESLKNINTKIFKKNKLRNLNDVFNGCISLKEIDLSYFETEYMTELLSTFENCKSLEKINFTNFDTSRVERMDYMFYGCESLIYLDLSDFNLENLTYSANMFAYCINLIEIRFNDNTSTKNLEFMEAMFRGCESLESINTKIFK